MKYWNFLIFSVLSIKQKVIENDPFWKGIIFFIPLHPSCTYFLKIYNKPQFTFFKARTNFNNAGYLRKKYEYTLLCTIFYPPPPPPETKHFSQTTTSIRKSIEDINIFEIGEEGAFEYLIPSPRISSLCHALWLRKDLVISAPPFVRLWSMSRENYGFRVKERFA